MNTSMLGALGPAVPRGDLLLSPGGSTPAGAIRLNPSASLPGPPGPRPPPAVLWPLWSPCRSLTTAGVTPPQGLCTCFPAADVLFPKTFTRLRSPCVPASARMERHLSRHRSPSVPPPSSRWCSWWDAYSFSLSF